MLPTIWGRRWVRGWARTIQGQRMLEELLDLGCELPPPPVSGGARDFVPANPDFIQKTHDALMNCTDTDSILVHAFWNSDVDNDSVDRIIAGKRASLGAVNAGYLLFKTSGGNTQFSVSDGTDNITSNTRPLSVGWMSGGGYVQANAAADDDVGCFTAATFATEVNSVVLGSLANSVAFRAGTNSSGTSAWDGQIAWVRLFKKTAAAWSQGELDDIVEHRRKLWLPAGWGPLGTSSMILQWVLWDAGSPTTTDDLSGNGMTGTYSGTAAGGDMPDAYGPGGTVVFKRGITVAAPPRHRRTLLGVGR